MVTDVRDAVARIRAELPTDLREPVISRVTVIGEAYPDLRGIGHRAIRN